MFIIHTHYLYDAIIPVDLRHLLLSYVMIEVWYFIHLYYYTHLCYVRLDLFLQTLHGTNASKNLLQHYDHGAPYCVNIMLYAYM